MKLNSYTPPEEVFGDLFIDLQTSGLWEDDKFLSDAIPIYNPEIILEAYQKEKDSEKFNLKTFFENHFRASTVSASSFKSDPNKSTIEHIKSLWPYLKREADEFVEGSSLIPLSKPYIVPGGRFNEIYYWDSFFTMLGLKKHGEIEVIQDMVDNFAWMIQNLGFIPNGNRTYFLGRSQPPFFSLMVQLLAEIKGEEILVNYLEELKLEHAFWMQMSEDHDQHVVRYQNCLLNRYYDAKPGPRPEMFATDRGDFMEFKEPENYYRHVRAACESGWDFTCRWFKDPMDLASIQTLDIVQVDLNSLLWNLEATIEKAMLLVGDKEASKWHDLAAQRALAIQKLFWNEKRSYFCDINHKEKDFTAIDSLAGVFPLYFKLASKEQAQGVADKIAQEFLRPGGVVSTTFETGQQWDSPNGWAPLQYMTVVALENYGFNDLAETIKKRWIALCDQVYKNTGKMLEKYNVCDLNLLSGGGEYPVQDGFGWSNGVYAAFHEE